MGCCECCIFFLKLDDCLVACSKGTRFAHGVSIKRIQLISSLFFFVCVMVSGQCYHDKTRTRVFNRALLLVFSFFQDAYLGIRIMLSRGPMCSNSVLIIASVTFGDNFDACVC